MTPETTILQIEQAVTEIDETALSRNDYRDKVRQAIDRVKANVFVQNELNGDAIVKAAAEVYGVTVEEISTKSRNRDYAYPRFLAYTFIQALAPEPLEKTGLRFNRDHCTVLHGQRKMSGWILDGDKTVKPYYDAMCARFSMLSQGTITEKIRAKYAILNKHSDDYKKEWHFNNLTKEQYV